ncbi:hypothetical protein OUZ56_029338 [Daphnia magna]|uniref:Uncharacterized protein n=1 Tax=Daphnia magna TaxID=35525 RepID=A0ABR0B6I1_9CRUS|nr:hypothetical protein OUZ56_029338 [Daphnia magna]
METSLELHVDPGNLAPVPIASMKGRILQPIGQFYNSLMHVLEIIIGYISYRLVNKITLQRLYFCCVIARSRNY